VWVFSVYKKVQFDQTSSAQYCLESLYQFIFRTLVAQWSLAGLFICAAGWLGLIILILRDRS
jgi:hypothetical protein